VDLLWAARIERFLASLLDTTLIASKVSISSSSVSFISLLSFIRLPPIWGLVVFLSSLPTGKKEAHRTKNLKNIFALCHEALAEGKTV